MICILKCQWSKILTGEIKLGCGGTMKFYRYFHNIREPFLKITDIRSDNVQEYLKLIEKKSLAVKTYNSQYIRNRLFAEKIMKEEFIKKGGKPVLDHPHYLVLENCDNWFYQSKNNIGSLAIDSNRFSKETISFTYGDSVPTFLPIYNDEKEYRNKIYTMDEIKEIIGKYSMPQLWNENCQYGFENYIEVQVWSDEIISEYNFEDSKNIYSTLDLFYHAIINANQQIKSVLNSFPEQINLNDAIKKMYQTDYKFDLINRLYKKFSDIYVYDRIHGIEHAYRTALYMLFMGKSAKVDENFLNKMIIAGFAHDIGRKFSNGEEHGKISATMLEKILPVKDMNILKKALIAHSIKNYQLYMDINVKKNDEVKMIEWLRDADTLDYIRFGIRGYNPQLLKTKEAKRIFKVAMELNLYMYIYPKDEFKLFCKEKNCEEAN